VLSRSAAPRSRRPATPRRSKRSLHPQQRTSSPPLSLLRNFSFATSHRGVGRSSNTGTGPVLRTYAAARSGGDLGAHTRGHLFAGVRIHAYGGCARNVIGDWGPQVMWNRSIPFVGKPNPHRYILCTNLSFHSTHASTTHTLCACACSSGQACICICAAAALVGSAEVGTLHSNR